MRVLIALCVLAAVALAHASKDTHTTCGIVDAPIACSRELCMTSTYADTCVIWPESQLLVPGNGTGTNTSASIPAPTVAPTYTTKQVCSQVWFVHYPVIVVVGEGIIVDLYESEHRRVNGYASEYDAAAWAWSMAGPSGWVNCTVTAGVNGTDVYAYASATGARKHGHGDDDLVHNPLFWTPMIVIVCCIAMLGLAAAGIAAAVAYYARVQKSEEF